MRTAHKRLHDMGFTLLEMTIVVAVLAILAVIVGAALSNAMRAWDIENNYAQLSADVRTAVMRISESLALASLNGDASATPPVTGVTFSGTPPDTVVFQTPLSADGSQWTPPITIRLLNEDTNGDLILNPAETDLNENGMLDRIVERLSDINQDGDFDDANETQVLGRDIDSLIFTQTGNRIDISITGRRNAGQRNDRPLVFAMTASVGLSN